MATTTPTSPPYTPKTLATCITARHSTRLFTPDPVPITTLRTCATLATNAPSNSNTQPWRLRLAHGTARTRIVSALQTAAAHHGPRIAPLPAEFNHFRSAMGHKLYGPEGWNIPRENKEDHYQAQLRNYEFFGAPVCGLITLCDERLTAMDAMCVGLFVQNFVLALTERGLGSCLQVSIVGFPEVVRDVFKVGSEEVLLCGIAIGWPAVHPVNQLDIGREEVDEVLIMLEE